MSFAHNRGKANSRRTFNLSRTLCAHIFIIQIPDLLFLWCGQRCRVAGVFVRADDDAVGHYYAVPLYTTLPILLNFLPRNVLYRVGSGSVVYDMVTSEVCTYVIAVAERSFVGDSSSRLIMQGSCVWFACMDWRRSFGGLKCRCRSARGPRHETVTEDWSSQIHMGFVFVRTSHVCIAHFYKLFIRHFIASQQSLITAPRNSHLASPLPP